MDEQKIKTLILVMWERLVACGEIGGEYPYIEDIRFCSILESCKIEPTELDNFLTPSELK
jgi:hypothetical protein